MLLVADTLEDVRAGSGRVVGFFGAPPLGILSEVASRCGAPLLDLDVCLGAPPARILPEAYCHIIRNCVDNAAALGSALAAVVAATGKEKCDGGRFAAHLIRERLGVEVIVTENEAGAAPARPAVLCESRGPLKKRVVRIMRGIASPLDEEETRAAASARSTPTHGFWGTPPHPIELLDLFPETTHVFGWTRCVEQGRPADLELEMQVPGDLPTVFFSQGFCAKAALARHLAERHRGMHVDVHDSLSAATLAKIEAFVRLTAKRSGP